MSHTLGVMPCVRGVCISFEGQIKNLDGDDRPEAVRLREEMRSNRFHSIIRAATSPFQAGARTDGEPVDTKITAPGEVIRLIPSTFPPLSPLQEILCQWFPRFLRRPHASVVFLRHPMTRKSRAGGTKCPVPRRDTDHCSFWVFARTSSYPATSAQIVTGGSVRSFSW